MLSLFRSTLNISLNSTTFFFSIYNSTLVRIGTFLFAPLSVPAAFVFYYYHLINYPHLWYHVIIGMVAIPISLIGAKISKVYCQICFFIFIFLFVYGLFFHGNFGFIHLHLGPLDLIVHTVAAISFFIFGFLLNLNKIISVTINIK